MTCQDLQDHENICFKSTYNLERVEDEGCSVSFSCHSFFISINFAENRLRK